MNIDQEFYSKPSNQSLNHIYGRAYGKAFQLGGFIHWLQPPDIALRKPSDEVAKKNINKMRSLAKSYLRFMIPKRKQS